jgi:uncharacterized phage-associated protein
MPISFQFDWERALAALAYLASKNLPEFDKYKSCKLIFLADKYHLVRYARPITGDEYFAVPYGPIPSQTLDHLTRFEAGNDEKLEQIFELDDHFAYPRYVAKGESDFSVLSQSDIMALDRTAELYGQKSFAELKAITHAMPAYDKAWKSRAENSKRAEMAFEDFFEEEAESVKGALEEAIEQDQVRKAFPIRVF